MVTCSVLRHLLVLVDALVLVLQRGEGVAGEPDVAYLGIVVGVVDRAGEESLAILIGGVDGVLEEILGIHGDFLDGDTIYLHVAAAIVGYAWQLAQETVEVGAFGEYVGVGIECQGVALDIMQFDLVLVLCQGSGWDG